MTAEAVPAPPRDPARAEIVYRVVTDRFENGDPANDRGGIAGGRLDHGFDPRRAHFYHGGDLAGVRERLPYVAGLGASAILLTPVFGALPVAGPPGAETASFHGEWLVDLTRIDPHLGDMADLRALTDAARDRGMRVYVDVVLNGTADLFAYEGCAARACGYRSEAAFPYATRGDAFGEVVNPGFGAEGASADFRALTDPRWAYRPVPPRSDPRAPAWLRDPVHYHQRGAVGPGAEAMRNGDLPGQDDLLTEHPVVGGGLIDAHARLIEEGGVDGFRVRDARHVNPGFLAAFADAMRRRTALAGRPFEVWGEAGTAEAGALARFSHEGGLALPEDAAFEAAAQRFLSGRGAGALAEVFRADALYEGGETAALGLPTRVSSLAAGRLARAVRRGFPGAGPDETLERVRLGAVLLLTARGVPVLYMGDEQGFGGEGDASAQDMMPSAASAYTGARLLGTEATAAASNFDMDHPYYRFVARLAGLRRREAALSRGAHVTRAARDEGDVYAFSRVLDLGSQGTEILVVLNASDERRDLFVPVDPRSDGFDALSGYCASGAAARASYPVSVPPRGFVICKSDWGRAE